MPTSTATDSRDTNIRFDSEDRSDPADAATQFPGIDFGRLRRAEVESTRSLQVHRDGVRESKRATAGNTYGASGDRNEDRLVPEMQYVYETYCESLLPNHPTASIRTSLTQFMPSAFENEIVTNSYLKDIDFQELARELIGDSLFGLSIAKVTLQRKEIQAQFGRVMGWQPVCDRVSFDDFTFDHTALSFRKGPKFYGHYYKADLEWAKNNPDFDEKVRANLMPVQDYARTRQGGDRSAFISEDGMGVTDTVSDETMLLELYLPEQNLIVTYDGNDESETPLAVAAWNGVPSGPYVFLYYSAIGDNPVPLGFMQSLFLLDEVQQAMFSKTAAQAATQKNITAVRGAAAADGERVVNADDGGFYKLDNPDAVRQLMIGGFDPANLAFYMQVRQMFVRAARNPDQIAGLNPNSPTAAQDQLLFGAVTAHMKRMQERVTDFLTKIVSTIARYLYADPVAVYQIEKPYPAGLQGALTVQVTPEQRKRAWSNYQVYCEVYSAPPKSPQERAQKTMAFLQSVLMPLFPLMQQQGLMLDVQGLIRLLARDLGLSEELASIVIFGAPNDPNREQENRQEAAGKPPATTRTYKRINETPNPVDGQPGAGGMDEMAKTLMQMSASRRGAA